MSSRCWWKVKSKKEDQGESSEQPKDDSLQCQGTCPPMPQFDISKCKPLYITPDVKITIKDYPAPEGEEIIPIRYGGRYGTEMPAGMQRTKSCDIVCPEIEEEEENCDETVPEEEEEECECVCEEDAEAEELEDCIDEVVPEGDANNNEAEDECSCY